MASEGGEGSAWYGLFLLEGRGSAGRSTEALPQSTWTSGGNNSSITAKRKRGPAGRIARLWRLGRTERFSFSLEATN